VRIRRPENETEERRERSFRISGNQDGNPKWEYEYVVAGIPCVLFFQAQGVPGCFGCAIAAGFGGDDTTTWMERRTTVLCITSDPLELCLAHGGRGHVLTALVTWGMVIIGGSVGGLLNKLLTALTYLLSIRPFSCYIRISRYNA